MSSSLNSDWIFTGPIHLTHIKNFQFDFNPFQGYGSQAVSLFHMTKPLRQTQNSTSNHRKECTQCVLQKPVLTEVTEKLYRIYFPSVTASERQRLRGPCYKGHRSCAVTLSPLPSNSAHPRSTRFCQTATKLSCTHETHGNSSLLWTPRARWRTICWHLEHFDSHCNCPDAQRTCPAGPGVPRGQSLYLIHLHVPCTQCRKKEPININKSWSTGRAGFSYKHRA